MIKLIFFKKCCGLLYLCNYSQKESQLWRNTRLFLRSSQTALWRGQAKIVLNSFKHIQSYFEVYYIQWSFTLYRRQEQMIVGGIVQCWLHVAVGKLNWIKIFWELSFYSFDDSYIALLVSPSNAITDNWLSAKCRWTLWSVFIHFVSH